MIHYYFKTTFGLNKMNLIKRFLSKVNYIQTWEMLLAMLIFLVNLFLKSYQISNETIYGDEANSIYVSQQSFSKILAYMQYDQNPPAYFIILHLWIKLTGVSDISLKFLSIIFS